MQSTQRCASRRAGSPAPASAKYNSTAPLARFNTATGVHLGSSAKGVAAIPGIKKTLKQGATEIYKLFTPENAETDFILSHGRLISIVIENPAVAGNNVKRQQQRAQDTGV